MNVNRPFAFGLLLLVLAGYAPSPYVAGALAQAQPAQEAAAGPADPVPADWHHLDAQADDISGVSTRRAYEELLQGRQPAQTVVVAVLDSGVDIEHEDLKPNVWTNEDEVPGNGVDDDRNGYVDDLHGWNFLGAPDGRNLHRDTYEMTRELRRLRPLYEHADYAGLTDEQKREHAYFKEVSQAYEEKHAQMSQYHAQLTMAAAVFYQADSLVQQHFGGPYTLDQLSQLKAADERLQMAQTFLLDMATYGIDRKALREQLDETEYMLEYGLNFDFDERSLIGDDYADPTDRSYGNSDVIGPDARHGTHVAGIIAADRGNGVGMDGIVDPVRIMVVRVVPKGDERDKDVANAIRYAVDNGARVINMSFGKAFSPGKEAVDAAVRYAAEKGVLLVHGSGNDSRDVDTAANFPSRFYLGGADQAPNWIEVGASSWEGEGQLAADFSNYGKNAVDVFAPGVSIYSTVPGNGYDRLDGTSMAAPVVSGLAALLLSYFPDLTAEQVRDVILRSATSHAGERVAQPGAEGTLVDFAQLSRTGGIVNAYNALKLAQEM